MNSTSTSASVVVPGAPRPEGSPLQGVKHIIAVGSGKGGVGKSTVAINLSMALKKLGARVGLLDADIYGPSLPKLLGTREMPQQVGEKVIPPEVQGIKCMSMGLLGETPAIWRGPMASRAVTQFLSEVEWGELDYLILDLPPGTGDIQITLSQAVRLSGAVIVMTPQALATEIAGKGLKMFQTLRVPVIGIVENMSEYVCPQCGHHDPIFQRGGGEQVAKELGLPLLQRFPIDSSLVTEGDQGKPVVLSRPDSDSAKRFIELAQKMAAELSALLSGSRSEKPVVITVEPNQPAKVLKLGWNDGRQSLVSFRDLRYWCPCAHCVDEHSGKRKIQRESIAPDVSPTRINTIGNYAINIHWSDGHDTGIYSYDYLDRIVSGKTN
jgi:ATP-binding protein involved in chromosome partitioning